jgi:hypothetical protein
MSAAWVATSAVTRSGQGASVSTRSNAVPRHVTLEGVSMQRCGTGEIANDAA